MTCLIMPSFMGGAPLVCVWSGSWLVGVPSSDPSGFPDFQSFNRLEVAGVVGEEGAFQNQGSCGDPSVAVVDGLSPYSTDLLDARPCLADFAIRPHYIVSGEVCCEQLHSSHGPRLPKCPPIRFRLSHE